MENLTDRVRDLEQRVQVLEDTEDIKKLHREYLFFISNLEFDNALACFSDSITVDIANYGVRKGKEAVAKLFKEVIYQNVLQSRDAHFTGQSVISVKGDRAEGHWMFYRLLHNPSPVGWVQGRYDCEYVRRKELEI